MSKRRKITLEYLRELGDSTPKLALARMLHHDHPELFGSVEQARDAIRYYSGARQGAAGEISPRAVEVRQFAKGDREGRLSSLSVGEGEEAGKKEWDEKKDSATWSYEGNANITTLDQAIEFSKVDMTVWEVERHTFNTWTTTMRDKKNKPIQKWNIQVKVWFKRKHDAGISWAAVRDELDAVARSRSTKKAQGSGVGFVATADFHLGAYVDDLIRSDKFNISVLSEYLGAVADTVNAKKYKEVHVGLLGDFIESFTGLNHANSWKGLGKGMFGMNAIILCAEVLSDCLLSRINNLSGVYLVSGNHCRVTEKREGDEKGEVGIMIHYLLSKSFPAIPVKYHPMIMSADVDGVYYVMTHGHLPISKRETAKILFDYGRQGMFNVLLSGHMHSRSTTKSYRKKHHEWDDKSVVSMDEVDYRALVAPPMFTGNFFSESLGYSSSAGFLLIESNGKGRVNVFDYCL